MSLLRQPARSSIYEELFLNVYGIGFLIIEIISYPNIRSDMCVRNPDYQQYTLCTNNLWLWPPLICSIIWVIGVIRYMRRWEVPLGKRLIGYVIYITSMVVLLIGSIFFWLFLQ